MKPIYNFKKFDMFTSFVVERHRVYRRRENGDPRPWTADPILREYKFTNVYRELDRVTRWIRENWREPFANERYLFHAMVLARLINHPETLSELPSPGRWNKARFLKVMHERQDAGLNTFSSAYIVSTNGQSMNKADYLADYVLEPMWKARDALVPKRGQTLASYYESLFAYNGMGRFIAAQIIADLKYVRPLVDAPDWWTFVSSGPGSRKGMSYLCGFSPKLRWREHEWRDAVNELSVLMKPVTKQHEMPDLHNQDLQNCLCEFSKWSRTMAGTGRPKQKFKPFGGS